MRTNQTVTSKVVGYDVFLSYQNDLAYYFLSSDKCQLYVFFAKNASYSVTKS